MYSLVAAQSNRTLFLCVKDNELVESKQLLTQLGYKIVKERKLGKEARFHRKETSCLPYLRKQIREL